LACTFVRLIGRCLTIKTKGDRGVKKTIVLSFLVLGMVGAASADDYKVPAINEKSADPLPIFSKEQPLTARDRAGLEKAKNWINADQYPYRDGNRVTYLFDGGQVTVVCAPLKLCVVELAEREKVMPNGVHLGDSARWMVSPSVGAGDRTHIIIKPVEVALETSLVLITDQRTYHLRLVSSRNDYIPITAFHYPDQISAQWQAYYENKASERQKQTIPETGENIADLDFNYSISGCSQCSWRPLRVYNNGQQTIIQMGEDMKQGEAPALLVKSRKSKQLVNYRVQNGRYIVDQIFNEAILVMGVGSNQDRVTIRRTDHKNKNGGHHGS
jgi:type IV secretion system protein TrbG